MSKFIFLDKKKKYINLSSAELTQRVVKAKKTDLVILESCKHTSQAVADFSYQYVAMVIIFRRSPAGSIHSIRAGEQSQNPFVFNKILSQPYQWKSYLRCLLGARRRPISACASMQSITKICLYNFYPIKPYFYLVNLGFTGVYMILLISAQKHRLWVLVRTASSRNMKIIRIFHLIFFFFFFFFLWGKIFSIFE